MLRKFKVHNFKSLMNITYEPGVINLLLGVNNSGKTNFCQALNFFSQTARRRGKIFEVWRDISQKLVPAKNVYFDHDTVDMSAVCDLNVAGEPLTFHYTLSLQDDRTGPVRVATETLKIQGGHFGSEGITLLENEAGKVLLLNEKSYLEGVNISSCYQHVVVDPLSTMLAQLHDKVANQRAMEFRNYLVSWQYYDLNPYRLRDDELDYWTTHLSLEGANLSSVLFQLKSNNERYYRQLIQLVSQIEPRLDALNFTPVGEHVRMELTDAKDSRFDVTCISNGTLRFMALAYIILGNGEQENPPLILIEEPENGLYMEYLKSLFKAIGVAGGQYIFTSHSPYFISLFNDYLDNIILLEDRKTHSVVLKPNIEKLQKYLENLSLDKLRYRDMFE